MSLLKLMSDKSDRAKERIPNPGFDEFKRYLPYLMTHFCPVERLRNPKVGAFGHLLSFSDMIYVKYVD